MSMSKKDFIALADAIREHNQFELGNAHPQQIFTQTHIEVLARFCAEQNSNFMRSRWIDYVYGKCGQNGYEQVS